MEKTRSRSIIWLNILELLIVLLAIACSSLQGKEAQTEYDRDLGLKIQVNQSILRANETVMVTFTLQNTGNRVLSYESLDTPVFDIIAEDVSSHKRYVTWSIEHPDLVAHEMKLAPGESRTIELTWALESESAISGTVVRIAGLLDENSRSVKSVGVLLCINYC